MLLIKQISIFVENKAGRLAEIAQIIGGAGIDIHALSVADTSDFGVLRLIADKPEQAADALREANLTVTLTDVIAVQLPDRPGGFAQVISVLAGAGIGIEYMYAAHSRCQGTAYAVIRVEQPAQACAALEAGGVQVLDRI